MKKEMRFEEQDWQNDSDYLWDDGMEENYTMGSGNRLSLKNKMTILSRRDRMGRLKPTWYRMLIVLVLLLVVMTVIQRSHIVSNRGITGATVEQNEVQLTFVGDISLGEGVEQVAESKGYSSLFYQASKLWEKSSLVFANLETPILRQNTVYGQADKAETVSASWTALKVASERGVNVVSVANDHVGDYGRKGIEHTLEALENYGVAYAGAGENLTEAASYKLIEADGVTVGFVSFTDVIPKRFTATGSLYGVSTSSFTEPTRNVLNASRYSDFVVVYVHWGEENSLTTAEEQQQLAHQLIESGADVVIGTHPKVLQSVELYEDGIIFYSLGTFIDDTIQRDECCSVMVQLNVNKESGAAEFTLIPMRISDFRPTVTESSLYIKRIQNALTGDLNAGDYTVDEDGWIHISMDLYTPGEKQEEPVAEGDKG